MPSLKSFSAAEEEDDQLCRNPEAAEIKEAEEDPVNIEEKDADDDEEEDVERDQVEADDEEALEEKDSKERSESSSEFMNIGLGDIRKDVQCPICLGIIKKTRTVMECLHRFCRECIDKSMRLGNKECPACRKHCASRRSLRDDPKFDAFIAVLFKNIDRFEKEELVFHEDEMARKNQIQVSIAQVSQRQSDALAKKRSSGKETRFLARTQRTGSSSRRRSNYRNMEQDTSEAHDDDDGNNNIGKDSSSDEPCAEILLKKRRKCSTNHPYSSANNNVNCADNGKEEGSYKDSRGRSPGLVWNPEVLAWGRGGTRSNTRQGNHGASHHKSVRNARLNRLVEYLGSVESNSDEMDIHLKLIALDTKGMPPTLLQPYICCRPTLLVKQLREYVALKMQFKAEEVELSVYKAIEDKTSSSTTKKMQSLKDDETLAKLKVDCISSHECLIIVYQQKQFV
ncbi:unnamed protein product [Cochlearia groenlandica]